jgi:hypothetical protein
MLTNIMATGKFAWTPSQGMFSDDVSVGDGTKNTSNNYVNLEEGSENFKEDSIPNYVSDVNNMVIGVNFSVSTSNPSSSGKRKAPQYCPSKSVKKKIGSGMGAQLLSRLDKLVDSASTISDYKSSFMDKKECSFEEVMAEFHYIDELVLCNELYCFAIIFFIVISKREMGETIGSM